MSDVTRRGRVRPRDSGEDEEMKPSDSGEDEEMKPATPTAVFIPDILRELAAMRLAEDEHWWQHSQYFDDENKWQIHPGASAFARELVACVPENLNHGVQLFRVDVNWLEDNQYHPWTFSRECTRQLAAIIISGVPQSKFLLTGNPGIGKSRFLWELLRDLLLHNRLVVFELRKTEQVFIFVPPRPGQDGGHYRAFRVSYSGWKRDSCAALRDKQTFWLIDPNEGGGGAPPDLPARIVLAASPNNEHYKGWEKHILVETRYMPPWSLEELLTVRETVRDILESQLPPGARDTVATGVNRPTKRPAVESKLQNAEAVIKVTSLVDEVDLLTDEAVRERFEAYGGIFRIVYKYRANKRQEYNDKIDAALKTLPDDKMRVAFESADELDVAHFQQESKNRVSSALFVYVSVYPFQGKAVVPASPQMLRRVRDAYLARVRRFRDPTMAEYRDAFEHYTGCHIADAFAAAPLERPTVDKKSFVATPADLAAYPLALPSSPFAGAARLRENDWKGVLARLVSAFTDAVPPAELPEGWSRHGLIIKPNNTNQPVIDFFEVLWLRCDKKVIKVPVAYQATVSTTHRMTPVHLEQLLDRLGCSAERPLLLVFVVPEYVFVSRLVMFRQKKEVFNDFKAQRCKDLSKQNARHQALLNRIVQFKCKAILPNAQK